MHAGVQLRVHATRAIAAGEALTISYVDLLSPPFSRQATLLQSYGFWCRCTRCSAPATPGVGHACLWTVRKHLSCPGRPGSAGNPWQLVPRDGPLQDVCAAAGAQAEQGTGARACSGGGDPGEEGASWDSCPAVREAAHAMHQVAQVMQAQDLQPAMLQALKRRLSVRLPGPV